MTTSTTASTYANNTAVGNNLEKNNAKYLSDAK